MSEQIALTLVGGPTAVLEFGGIRIITDPTFDPPQSYKGHRAKVVEKVCGPALQVEDVLPIEVALVSHDHHPDNLDKSGREMLQNCGTVFTTVEGAERLGHGVIGLAEYASVDVILPDGRPLTVTGVPAHHGPDGYWHDIGPVVGFVLSGPDLPTVYVSGDNSSVEVVQEIADRTGRIDLAVLFTGGARFAEVAGGELITLSNDRAVEAARSLGEATVVPIHAEGWAHFAESPQELQDVFREAGMEDRLVIVLPGETAKLAF